MHEHKRMHLGGFLYEFLSYPAVGKHHSRSHETAICSYDTLWAYCNREGTGKGIQEGTLM